MTEIILVINIGNGMKEELKAMSRCINPCFYT